MQVILYLIDKLNVDKSLGPDGTCLRVLKELKGEIGELLAIMCKVLITKGCGARDLERVAVPPQREVLNSETGHETRQVIQT